MGFDVSAMSEALEGIAVRVRAATPDAAERGADIIVQFAQENAPKRTGALAASIYADDPEQEGDTWVIHMAPHIVYGRILELGGVVLPRQGEFLWFEDLNGQLIHKRSVFIPARPYFGPAIQRATASVNGALVGAWGEAMGG